MSSAICTATFNKETNSALVKIAIFETIDSLVMDFFNCKKRSDNKQEREEGDGSGSEPERRIPDSVTA